MCAPMFAYSSSFIIDCFYINSLTDNQQKLEYRHIPTYPVLASRLYGILVMQDCPCSGKLTVNNSM